MKDPKLRFVRTVTDIECFLDSPAHKSIDEYLNKFVKAASEIIVPELLNDETLSIEGHIPGSTNDHKLKAYILVRITTPAWSKKKGGRPILIELSNTGEIGFSEQQVFGKGFKEFIKYFLPLLFPKKVAVEKQEVET